MHGGSLRIDSVLGKGTTVSFSLPREAQAPAAAGPEREPDTAAAGAP